MESTCKFANIKMSASSPNSPRQNGFCERIMNTIKNEGNSLYFVPNIGYLCEAVAARIYYYNHLRIHTGLKMLPAVYATKNGLNKIDKASGKVVA